MKRFEKKGYHTHEPMAWLYRGLFIVLNATALREYVRDCRYCDLYYDDDRNMVAIKIAEQPLSRFSLKISVRRERGKRRGALIAGKNFIREFHLPETTDQRPLAFNPSERVLSFRVPRAKA